MKILPCLVYCVLIAQTSASFFDRLQGALHSVQRGFGKLLSDVVVDVTDTVHCTISAVEKVLSLSGLVKIQENSHGHKCKTELPPAKARYRDDPVADFIKARNAIIDGGTRPHPVHDSISKLNSTLREFFHTHRGRQKMKSLSKVLKDETDQLTKVSDTLREELHNISRNVDSEIQKYESEPPSIWSELEDRRNTELERDSPQPKDDPFEIIRREFEQMREAIEWEDSHEESEDTQPPQDFREAVEKEKDKLDPNVHNNEPSPPSPPSQPNLFDAASDRMSPFYDPAPTYADDHHRAVEDALSVIRDSERTDAVLDNLKDSGADLFSNKDMFNF